MVHKLFFRYPLMERSGAIAEDITILPIGKYYPGNHMESILFRWRQAEWFHDTGIMQDSGTDWKALLRKTDIQGIIEPGP